MKPLNGYNEAAVITEQERLPVGGYILKVLGVEEITNEYGTKILISFDIAEGECKDFYAKNYNAQTDENKKWKGTHRVNVPEPKSSSDEDMAKYRKALGFFKGQMNAFEQSNTGLKIDCEKDWDVKILKGKLVGGVFGNKEWEMNGKKGFFTNCDKFLPVQNIRDGKFKVPPDKLLNGSTSTASSGSDHGSLPADFEETLADGRLPF